MDIAEFLPRDRVLLDIKARDKAQLLSDLARRFAPLPAERVETALQAREQLGSTGLGASFALPHARIEGLTAYAGLFARLAKPIDFESIDGKPVGMVFVLLIPFDSATPHVAALAAISRRFRDPALVSGVQRSKTPAEAYAVLVGR